MRVVSTRQTDLTMSHHGWITQRMRFLVVAWMASGLIITGSLTAADRWAARLASGETVIANEITTWNEPQSEPAIAGRKLFDPANPVQSLADRQQRIETPTAYVEFIGGDRLVGEVQGHRAYAESIYETAPPHLLVKPVADVHPLDQGVPTSIRVRLDWLRKIVWEPVATNRDQPGTVWLRSGGQVAFRNLRWMADGIDLLTPTGLRSLSLVELAEIHFPRQPAWPGYIEQLAELTPQLNSRLLLIESRDGSRLTTSRERFEARHWGDRNRSESWFQLITPAWSLDTMHWRFPQLSGWTMFDPTEPPLSWAEPDEVTQTPVLAGSWHWQRDRNTQRAPLQIANEWYLRGFGVHGSTALTFQLPPMATEFRTRCGLDVAAGTGGSVRLSIRDRTGRELFGSEPLVGSHQVLDSGWVSAKTSTSAEPPVITLQADMLATGLPAGADPFDIRDIVSWGDPYVRLDRAELQLAVNQQVTKDRAGLVGWTVSDPQAAGLTARNWLDESDYRAPTHRRIWSTTQPWIGLSRTMKVAAEDRWVSVILTRFEKASVPTLVHVQVDGMAAGEFEIPVRQGPIDPLPISVPLPAGPSRSVQIDLAIFSTQPDNTWDLRSIVAGPEVPGIRWLYDDDSRDFVTANPQKTLKFPTTGAFSQTAAIEFPAGRTDVAELGERSFALVDWPRLGEYRFLTWAWKGSDVPGVLFSLAHEGRIGLDITKGMGLTPRQARRKRGPNRGWRVDQRGLQQGFTYSAGQVVSPDYRPLKLADHLPAEWTWMSRDLVQDFGPMELTGLGVDVQGRGVLQMDALAIVRTPEDVEQLKRRFQPATDQKSDAHNSFLAWHRADWNAAVGMFAPQFTTPEAAHGLVQKREHQGQVGGWQTHPRDAQQPFVLRRWHQFPKDRPQELDLLVSHAPYGDWLLQVRVAGNIIFEKLINTDLVLPQRGYASLQVDLSAYQGQSLLVEVLNSSNDGQSDYAYWKRVDLRDR
jgi:hypothetical protein